MWLRNKCRRGILWLSLPLLLFSGCGEPDFRIQGTVSINGAPLEQAEIMFVPMDSVGGDYIGTVVSNGKYQIRDVVRLKEGEYQVQIRAYRPTGEKIWDGMGDGENQNMVDDLRQFIPPKYNDVSELKVSLKQGNNEFNADLQIDD